MTDTTEIATRAVALAQSVGLPSIVDADALAKRLAMMGVMMPEFVRDADLIAKMRTLANDASLFVQDAPLNGPGPKLPAGFVAYLGGLAPDFLKMPAYRRMGPWSDWCSKSGHQARTESALTPKPVAPIPCATGTPYNPELERLETRLRKLDALPMPQGFQARQQHQRSREFIQSKIDRITGTRRRTAA